MSDERWRQIRQQVREAARRVDARQPQPDVPFEPLVGPLTPRPNRTLADHVFYDELAPAPTAEQITRLLAEAEDAAPEA